MSEFNKLPTYWKNAINKHIFKIDSNFMKCNNCGLDFDMKKLSEVIKHESCIKWN